MRTLEASWLSSIGCNCQVRVGLVWGMWATGLNWPAACLCRAQPCPTPTPVAQSSHPFQLYNASCLVRVCMWCVYVGGGSCGCGSQWTGAKPSRGCA